MIKIGHLPKEFQPYSNLNLCSNEIIGGGHIFSFNEILPLLIGKGEFPMIWLQAPKNRNAEEFAPIVYNSESVHPLVTVKVNKKKKETTIFIKHKKILSVREINSNSAVVDFIDLDSLGFKIRGSNKNLAIGVMQLSNNKFNNVSVAFGLA